ncbi:MAG: hypothetical protein Q8M91_11595 [Polaromonas sp.]|nr:hypothetical protein [Polaromonas sp.]
MPISKQELEDMNDLLSKGKTIAELAKKYPKYEYLEIYWQVNDYSFLGKKRTISNRLKKLSSSKSSVERKQLAKEAQTLLNELYKQLKHNSSKLAAISNVLREK